MSAAPVLQAGPAHIATLKRPARRCASSRAGVSLERAGAASGSSSPPPTARSQLRVHLMSAGRIRYLAAGAKGPKTPAFRLRFENSGEIVLTEAGPEEAGRSLARVA